MKISIIGAGNIGGTLTRRLTALGHEVAVANSRGPESLVELARETGARNVWIDEAARDADIIIVAIPEKNVTDLPRDLFAWTPTNTIIVDTGNYYPRQRDGWIEGIEGGSTESRWVSEQIGRSVVKAFNNIYAAHLMNAGRPRGAGDRVALPVAGDNFAAKRVVMGLIDELGFDAVDAGSLDESWRQQPGSPVYTTDFDAERLTAGLGRATRQRSPDWRAV